MKKKVYDFWYIDFRAAFTDRENILEGLDNKLAGESNSTILPCSNTITLSLSSFGILN